MFLLAFTVFFSLVLCGASCSFQMTFGNHKTTGALFFFCSRSYDLGRCYSSESSAVEVVSRLHNHNSLRKSFGRLSANQIAEPLGALQGHFVRLQSIMSRMTTGPGEVALDNLQPT